jgi:dTDP-4-dehydrorhamnose reductase
MHILLLGKNGQLGWELHRTLPVLGTISAAGRENVDLSDPIDLQRFLRIQPWDVVINAAAYTAVDRAEIEKEKALKINADAPRLIAEEAYKRNGIFIHFSTDYVFDGNKEEPYTEQDSPNPINYYGETKLAGERAIQDVGGTYYIFRTSWLYNLRGENFVTKVLQWANKKNELHVVIDQYGCPTWSRILSELTSQALSKMLYSGMDWTHAQAGIYHLASVDHVNRYELACAIIAQLGLGVDVKPSLTRNFPSPAFRPRYTALNSEKICEIFGLRTPPWIEMLELALKPMTTGESEIEETI